MRFFYIVLLLFLFNVQFIFSLTVKSHSFSTQTKLVRLGKASQSNPTAHGSLNPYVKPPLVNIHTLSGEGVGSGQVIAQVSHLSTQPPPIHYIKSDSTSLPEVST